MDIAIIEFKDDLYQALRIFDPTNTIFISVSAEASYFLSRERIFFITEEDVLRPEEIIKIGEENFEVTEKWTENLDREIHEIYPFFREKHFYPFKLNYYRLKILLDAVRVRKVLIERLIDKESPLTVGIPEGSDAENIRDLDLFFYKKDSLYGILAYKIVAEKSLRFEIWKRVSTSSDNNTFFKSKIIAHLSKIKKLDLISANLLNNLISKKDPNRRSILVGTLSYDVASIIKTLSNHFKFYYYEGPCSIRSLKGLAKLKIDRDNVQPLSLDDIDINKNFKSLKVTGDPIIDEIIGKRVNAYAKRFIPLLWNGLNYLESIDLRKKFYGFINFTGASDAYLGLPIMYFTREKRPVFIIQHGAYGFALNKITNYSEFNHEGYFISWGHGIREMYDNLKKGSCNIIPAGSHLIEEIRRKRTHRKKIKKICYIPGVYRGYTAYFPGGQPFLDSKLFLLETDFLLTLKQYMNKYEITYKIAPSAKIPSIIFGKNPIIDWLKNNLQCVKIESKPLMDVIDKFDLFIIDWPTTTLIQTLASAAELIVFIDNPYYRMTEEAILLLEKRACVGRNPEDFKEKIKKVLDNGEIISDVENIEFLKKYGIYLDDRMSLKRMADIIIGVN